MIAEYKNYLTSIKGYSENTAKAYTKDIKHFVIWVKATRTDVRWSNITREDIDAYVTDMCKAGLKPATTNRHLASISSLYKYMKRQGYEVENPCKYESRRKQAKTIPNTIPTEDLKTAYEKTAGVTKVMIGLLATTGMRLQELLDLRFEDINFKTQSLTISGKGAKQRIVYTTADKLETLKAVYEHGHKSGRVFTIEQRQARFMIWSALRPYSQAKQLSPHAIRHTVATNYANGGANVTTIATILGHNEIKTTQKYIDMTQGNTREVQTQLNLFNQL